jgi:hypothetical protein
MYKKYNALSFMTEVQEIRQNQRGWGNSRRSKRLIPCEEEEKVVIVFLHTS